MRVPVSVIVSRQSAAGGASACEPPISRLEPDPLPTELALQHRDLIPQGQDLRVLVAVITR